VVLEMLFGGSDNLDGDEFVATLLKAGDDVTNETTLISASVSHIYSGRGICSGCEISGVDVGLFWWDEVVEKRTWTPSGLTAMKLGGKKSIERMKSLWF
jgi:hypothetical protein